MHHYKWHPKDYMADTAHLDEMEDLAYRRMLDWQYLNESSLPADIDKIAKLIRMRSHSESIAFVLQEFYMQTETGYENHRVSTELSRIYEKSEKARDSANARWARKNANAMRTHSERNANGMLPTTHYPLPSNPLPKSLTPTKEEVVINTNIEGGVSPDGVNIETGEVVSWK